MRVPSTTTAAGGTAGDDAIESVQADATMSETMNHQYGNAISVTSDAALLEP